jgi:hypothetical protein
MKISKNTCLYFLDDPEHMDFAIPNSNKNLTIAEQAEFGKSIVDGFIKLIRSNSSDEQPFKEKIRYLSLPFIRAYEKGRSKLINVFDKEPIDETGTFVSTVDSVTTTIFYYIKTRGNGEEWDADVTILVFNKRAKQNIASLDAMISMSQDEHKTFLYKGWEDNGINKYYFVSWIVTMICFIKYCPVETKVIEAGRKGYHADQKYVNETKHKIEVLDSSWFTNIVRSEGFSVGGHFRMQPYGPGHSQRRLQWIDPFEKQGYTRKAKKNEAPPQE